MGSPSVALPQGFVLDQQATALPAGFVLDQAVPAAPDIGEDRESTVAALRGIPVVGAYVDKATAALNAAAQPLTETGLSHAGTFAERMAENEKQIKAATDQYEAAHPIGTTVGKMAMGTAAMAPALALAPEAFGVTGATLAGRVAAGAASGGALGGADALARGEDVAKGAALGAALGGAGPVAGHVVGKVTQGVRDLVSPAQDIIPSGHAIKDAATEGYNAVRDAGVTVKPESVQKLASDIRTDLRGEGHRDYLSPKTFGVLDELENGDAFTTGSGTPSSQHAQDVADIRKRFGDDVAAAFDRQAQPTAAPATPTPPSLLQFIASKGGLAPDAELDAIGLANGHRAQIPGQSGFFGVVRKNGADIDRMREAAEEAGYLRGENGATSTPRDFLDAIDAELRGQKRYPEGYEGAQTKRQSAALSEREQGEHDQLMQGFHNDLNDAGHAGLAPDVKQRAAQLMANEGMHPDDAVEHAMLQLDQEEGARPVGNAVKGDFPGDQPAARPIPAPPQSRVVSFSDLHGLRRALGKAAQSLDPVEKAAASKAITRLDNYLENIPASDVIGGDAGKAAAMLKEANANYHISKLAERLRGKIDAAELQAASANSGANLENALRQRIKDVLKSPKLSQGFNQSEKLMMQRIVRGSVPSNMIRTLGNMLGGGGGIGAIISGGAGALAGGPVGAVVAPAAGMALKKIGARMTEAQLERLDTMIRARAPHSQQARATAMALENARAARLARSQGGGAIVGRAVNPTASGALLDDRRERGK